MNIKFAFKIFQFISLFQLGLVPNRFFTHLRSLSKVEAKSNRTFSKTELNQSVRFSRFVQFGLNFARPYLPYY